MTKTQQTGRKVPKGSQPEASPQKAGSGNGDKAPLQQDALAAFPGLQTAAHREWKHPFVWAVVVHSDHLFILERERKGALTRE